jgi:hypothetical protein
VRGQITEAASLLAAGSTLRERAGDMLSAADDADHQRLLTTIRTALGAAEFEQAWTRGKAHADADPISYGLQYALK